jgi:hypothetical protein
MDGSNAEVYVGREFIPKILFGLSDYKIRGFSMGSGGCLAGDLLEPNPVTLLDNDLTKIIELVPENSSETITQDYIQEDGIWNIKKIKDEYITFIPDTNNDGKYLIVKIIIPIDKMEYNGTMESGTIMNEAALWLMDENYENKKLFAKKTMSSINKMKMKPYNYLWTLFF